MLPLLVAITVTDEDEHDANILILFTSEASVTGDDLADDELVVDDDDDDDDD